MWFFSLQVFPFWSQRLADIIFSMCSFFFHLFSSTRVVVIALVNLNWSVFVSLKLSQIGSYH